MDKDQHVNVSQPLGSEPGLRVRAVDASDVTAIADFQTTCWREAYRGVVSQAYLDRVDVAESVDGVSGWPRAHVGSSSRRSVPRLLEWSVGGLPTLMTSLPLS
jgi:hypothetical protein